MFIEEALQLSSKTSTVSLCYAPIDEASEEEKEAFYLALQDTAARVPKHDMLVDLGDLNAEIGMDNKGFEEIMCSESCGNRMRTEAYF